MHQVWTPKTKTYAFHYPDTASKYARAVKLVLVLYNAVGQTWTGTETEYLARIFAARSAARKAHKNRLVSLIRMFDLPSRSKPLGSRKCEI